jgi:hypothetical protein
VAVVTEVVIVVVVEIIAVVGIAGRLAVAVVTVTVAVAAEEDASLLRRLWASHFADNYKRKNIIRK